jgi:tetratricopeptide (TPR) repeat protein
MKLRLALLVLALVLSTSSCISYREKRLREFTSSPLIGMVYDGEQKPCAGVLITVDGQAGPRTDVNGRFVIDALERGDHLLRAEKEGFETLESPLSFVDRTQVLYLRLISLGQLLREAEEALGRGKLQQADKLLARALALSPEDPVGLYLRAVYLLKLQDTAQAVGLLQRILARGERLPAVLLSLADIYQYRLEDPQQAMSYLREYLRTEDDPDIRARLTALEGPSAP